MAITNINGIPFIWDEEANKNLLGSLFPSGIQPPNFSDNLPKNVNNKDFKSISRNTWNAMRQGTSYQRRDIDTGPYTVNFYGLKEDEGIDLPGLISFIKKSISDCTIPFYWKDFEKPATYSTYRQRDTEGGFIDKMQLINNTIPFVYNNEAGKEQTAVFSAKMNKRTDYLEDTYAFSININQKGIYATLYYYYENTKQFRISATETTNPNDFNIDDKYLAISFSTENLTDFCYLLKAIEGNDSFQYMTRIIIKRYADAILGAKSNKELRFLYEQLPDFVARELSRYIRPEIMFTHIKRLTDLDDKGLFSSFRDSSNALINCMKAFGNTEYLYQQFENNSKLLKEIFYNLDGTSELDGQPMTNKLIFASLLSTMALIHSTDKSIKGNFKLSQDSGIGAYKINAHAVKENNKEKKEDSFFLQQQITTILGGGLIIPYKESVDAGNYYCPLDLVWLTVYPKKEADSEKNKPPQPTTKVQEDNTPKPMLVAAILVKALAHEQEVKNIQLVVRIGIDVFAIILTVATAGSAAPLATALLGIGLPIVDVIVALEEDELSKSPEGQAFLEAYNAIMLVGGLAATPFLINSFYKGFAFLFKNVVLEPSKKFLISAMIAVNDELKATNYIKGTEKVIIFEYKTVCTEVGYHFLKNSTVKALAEEGVVLVSGQEQVGEQLLTKYTAIYEGIPIAEGSMQEVRTTLEELAKSKGGLKAALANFIETAGKVKYGLSLLSQEAIRFRKTLGGAAKHNGNIAVFEWINKEGMLERRAFTTLDKQEEWVALGFSKNFRPHAEEIGMKILLENEGILAKDVKAIYSELEPCMLEGHKCNNKIKKMFPQAKVSYSYEYTDIAKRRKAITDRAKDLNNFIKK